MGDARVMGIIFRPPVNKANDNLRAFVTEVETATGQELTIYALDNWLELYSLPADLGRGRWVRRLGLRPSGEWVWWQVNNRAAIAGIDKPVDLNAIADN
jgi:GH25 family lysozyme M1 (1,4-beta-N-acetylmuramidase)